MTLVRLGDQIEYEMLCELFEVRISHSGELLVVVLFFLALGFYLVCSEFQASLGYRVRPCIKKYKGSRQEKH